MKRLKRVRMRQGKGAEATMPKEDGVPIVDTLATQEKEKLLRYEEERDSRTKPLEFALETRGEETTLKYFPPFFLPVLAETTGTYSEKLGKSLIGQAADAICTDEGEGESMLNVISAAMLGIKPQDTVEGLLATQMVAVHSQAMKFLGMAMKNRTSPEHSKNLTNIAARLLRIYTLQVDTLMKYRRKGNQTVTVEHIHVNKGGKAIVGNISHQGRGRGDNHENGE